MMLLRISLGKMQEDAAELNKRIFGCFKGMSRLFNDPVKTEENFQFLNQLKDANIWKILTTLLDPSTHLHQAWSCRVITIQIIYLYALETIITLLDPVFC